MDQVTISRELLRQAMGVIERSQAFVEASADRKLRSGWGDQLDEAEIVIISLRVALEQPAVEPEEDGWRLRYVYFQDGEPMMHTAPQAQQPAPQECKHCTKFFSQYRCNASQGECDCPKCQGFCTCSQQPRKTVKLSEREVWDTFYANTPPPCSDHPDAPHGFDRNRSHSLGRYVCDCEGWTP